jgi:mono/diheme cytochrome c family protein
MIKKQKNIFIAFLTLTLLSSCSAYAPKAEQTEKLQNKFQNKEAKVDLLNFPPYAPSILKGEEVYKQNCSRCHGANPGAAFTMDFMRSRTPEEQYIVVTGGNKQGMPAFKDTLSREQRWDALMYIRANVLGYFKADSDELRKMDALFGANCAVCHGTRGQGDGPLHKSLFPPPANFTQFSRLYTRSDDKLFDEISHGIPWTAMPAWENRYDFDQHFSFDDELRWKLVRYVRQFAFSQTLDRLDLGRENLEKYKESIED